MRAITISLLFALLSSHSIAQINPSDYRTNDTIAIEEVRANAVRTNNDVQMRSTQNLVRVDNMFLECNFNGTLAQTLSLVPGVSSMNVGSGQAKLAIRGMSFNRMVVAENGVKHQGQQWGDDHGLEVDMFSIGNLEIIKGPAALTYGSDAIGGVVSISSQGKPNKRIEGHAKTFLRSNNMETGVSTSIATKGAMFFTRAELTAIEYADYRVPADSIQYYSYYIRLHNQTMRNTAGREIDAALTIGFFGDHATSTLRISEAFSKNGFFADAHGLEVRLSQIDYDKSRRDIDLPLHKTSHTKIISNTHVHVGRVHINADLGVQFNVMEERSEPVSHGYMPTPNGTLERRFRKLTTTANIAAQTHVGLNSFRAGLQAERQRNRRGGWGFVIPDFDATTAGLFVADKIFIGDETYLNLGVRFDFETVSIDPYSDWYKTPVAGATDSVFILRSSAQSHKKECMTWSAGFTHNNGDFVFKANVGKSFRMPQPHELGADGVNYHLFRYERGNADLEPEESYQLDAGISYEGESFSAHVDPYVNLFPNFIYLNPSANYVEGLQLYSYTQSRVVRAGAEVEMQWRPSDAWEFAIGADLVRARQLSGDKKGFAIPFAPPASARLEAEYQFNRSNMLSGLKVGANVEAVTKQEDIVPPEKPTDGHVEIGASLSKDFPLSNGILLSANLSGRNLLNTRFYDHTSFYRLIDAPEPGRDISLMLSLKF